MTNQTSRQRYLYLVAKLYELAAEYTNEELKLILAERVANSDHSGIRQAIDALMLMHSSPNDVARTESVSESKGHRLPDISALGELFADRAAFPSVSDIANTIPLVFLPKNKESRERYISRLLKKIESLSEGEKNLFRSLLTSRLTEKNPPTFISKWTKVIGDL